MSEQFTTADPCICGHTRYMHNPHEGKRCCVSDHLMLVCTCDAFTESSAPDLTVTPGGPE